MSSENEIAALQAARKRPRSEIESSSSASSSSSSTSLPSVPSFGGDRRAIERQTRELINGAAQEGAKETDDSIFERHQKQGGSGMVRKTELDDYKKRKFKYFQDKLAAEKEKDASTSSSPPSSSSSNKTQPSKTTDAADAADAAAAPVRTKRARWDATPVINVAASGAPTTAGSNRWDATPVIQPSATTTTTTGATGRVNRWDATPVIGPTTANAAAVGKKKSRWDETPVGPTTTSTNAFGIQPGATASRFGETPQVFPTASGSNLLNITSVGTAPDPKMNAMQLQAIRYQNDLAYRNRPLTDEDLDRIFPKEGYKILEPPDGYERRNSNLLAAPSSSSSSSSSSSFASDAAKNSGFTIQTESESGLGAAMNVSSSITVSVLLSFGIL